MDERKKRIFRVLGAACLVFAAIIAYLLYFNFGLELQGGPGPGNSGIQVTVKNSSMHLIQDIEVFVKDSNGHESKIMSVKSLKPGEGKTTLLSEKHSANGGIEVEARAPMHLPVSKKIKVEGFPQESLEFSVEVEGRKKMFLNGQSSFTVKVCNFEPEDEEALISAEFEQTFFSNQKSPEERKVSVKSGECMIQEFQMIPKAIGATTISFNTTIEQINKRVEKEVEIIE